MSCDPQKLVDDAKCIEHCIPKGMQLSALIYVFCKSIDSIPCFNLLNNAPVPPKYGPTATPIYKFPIITGLNDGGSYTVQFGPNDLSLKNGTDIILNPGDSSKIPFIYTTPVQANGKNNPLQPVTLIICAA